MGLPMGLLPTDVALGLLLEWVLPPPPRGSHHQSGCWAVATNADSGAAGTLCPVQRWPSVQTRAKTFLPRSGLALTPPAQVLLLCAARVLQRVLDDNPLSVFTCLPPLIYEHSAACSRGMKPWKHLGPRHRLFASPTPSIMLNEAAECFPRGPSVPQTVNLSPTPLPHSSRKHGLQTYLVAEKHDDMMNKRLSRIKVNIVK